MPALLLKDLPADLHSRLKEEARKHRRSMTQEALVILEQGLAGAPNRLWSEVKPVACRISIDDAWIRRAREWGRK